MSPSAGEIGKPRRQSMDHGLFERAVGGEHRAGSAQGVEQRLRKPASVTHHWSQETARVRVRPCRFDVTRPLERQLFVGVSVRPSRYGRLDSLEIQVVPWIGDACSASPIAVPTKGLPLIVAALETQVQGFYAKSTFRDVTYVVDPLARNWG